MWGRTLHAICGAARYVGQHAEPTDNTSFFAKLPDIIFAARFV